MKVLGVTGGSGSGKTVVCRMLKEEGGKIIDADKIARKCEEKGTGAFDEIVRHFGDVILDKDGEIDRKVLGSIVFNDKDKLTLLNSIVHKHVTMEIRRRIGEYSQNDEIKFVALDVPIPIEEGFFDTVNCVWAVIANNDIRVNRLMARMGIDEDTAIMRISAQLSNSEYAAIADVVIDNEGSVSELKKLVQYELKRFLYE